MSDTTFSIIRTTVDDWNELRRIRLEALADTPEAFTTKYQEAAKLSDDDWRQMSSRRVFFIAQCEGRLVGMVSGGLNGDYPGTKWLYGMYVTPASRGSGVAASLVDVVSQWARNEAAVSLYLMVRSEVPRARAFYEKVGFVPAGDVIIDDQDRTTSMMTMVKNLD